MMTREIIERLRACLLGLERTAGAPRLDSKWLRARCDDTLAFKGQLRLDSIRQLKKDVARLDEAFPGLLSLSLIEAINAIDG